MNHFLLSKENFHFALFALPLCALCGKKIQEPQRTQRKSIAKGAMEKPNKLRDDKRIATVPSRSASAKQGATGAKSNY
jgi:hypothetical protein